MKKLLIYLALVGVIAGCAKEERLSDGSLSSQGVECTLNFIPEAMSVASDESTKGLVEADMQSAITSVNVFAYKSGKLATSSYSEDGACAKVIFPSRKDSYNLYFIANVGRVGAPQNEEEMSEMLVDLDRFASMQTYGFPMSGVQKSFSPGSATSIRLKRLVGAFSISMSNTASGAKYEILSVSVRNSAAQISPLGTRAATSCFTDGDVLSESEIASLNSGGSAVLYATENLQGVLIPGNTDPKAKIPSNLEDPTLQNRCTYLEVIAKITTASAVYDKVTYRMYLGGDETKDFTISRNTLYFLTLDFSTNLIHEEDWRIEAEYPEVVGEIQLSKSSVSIIKGIDDIMYVTSTSTTPDVGLDLVVSVDPVKAEKAGLNYTTYKTTYFGQEALAVRFSTSKHITSLLKWGDTPLTDELIVTLSSTDTFNGEPLVEAKFPLTVYRQAFPILLKAVNTSDNTWKLKAYSPNPLRLCFNVNTSIVHYDGTTSHTSEMNKDFLRYLEMEGGSVTEKGTVLSNDGVDLCRTDNYVKGRTMIVRTTFTPLYKSFEGDTKLFDTPYFAEGTQLYMGNNTAAVIGPGMYPQTEAEFQEDYWLYMDAEQSPSPSQKRMHGSIYSEGGTVFTFSEGTSGWNSQDDYDVEQFEGRPFYFVNGGMYVYQMRSLAEEPAYLDETNEYSLIYNAYEPGRDLGFVDPGSSRFGVICRHMYQMFGHYHSWLEWRTYEYSIYLTINGCSSWPGASAVQSGFVE